MESVNCKSIEEKSAQLNAEVCIEADEQPNTFDERNESNSVRTQTQQLSNSSEERKIDFLQTHTDLRCPCCDQQLTIQLLFESGSQFVKLIPVSTGDVMTGKTNKIAGAIEEPVSVTMKPFFDSESDCEEQQLQNDSSDSASDLSYSLHNGVIPTLESINTKTSFKKITKPTTNVTTIMISTQKGGQRHEDEPQRRASQVIALPTARNNGTIRLGLPSPNHDSSVSLICSFKDCKKRFTESFQYNLHMKQHCGEKVFACNWVECQRLFSSKQRLNDHIRNQHTGERPFQCEHCKKMFSSTKNLRAHKLLHTDERPYKCDWPSCTARFRRSHHLTAHRRIHTGERPFPCPHLGCNVAFTKSDHAKRHYLTHFRKSNKSNSSVSNQPKNISLDYHSDEVNERSFENNNAFDDCFDDENYEVMDVSNKANDDEIDNLKSTVLLDEKEGILKSVDC